MVITDDTVAGYLLGEAEREGIDILDDIDVVNVVDAHLAYFDAIGAVGPRAAEAELVTQPEVKCPGFGAVRVMGFLPAGARSC